MGAKEKLDEYTQAARELAIFDMLHRDIVKARTRLLKQVDDLGKEIKAEAHRTGSGPENRNFKVVVTPKTSRYYDAERLAKMYPEVTELKGVIRSTADRELVDHYRKIGIIPEDVAAECEESEILTPSVSIKAKCGFGKPTKEQREAAQEKKTKKESK